MPGHDTTLSKVAATLNQINMLFVYKMCYDQGFTVIYCSEIHYLFTGAACKCVNAHTVYTPWLCVQAG